MRFQISLGCVLLCTSAFAQEDASKSKEFVVDPGTRKIIKVLD